MDGNNYTGLLLIVCVLLLGAYFLVPIESIEEGSNEIATVYRHFDAVGNKASPKPYYIVKLKNGVPVEVQDYGQHTLKIGDKVIIKKQIGKVTNRKTYILIGKHN